MRISFIAAASKMKNKKVTAPKDALRKMKKLKQ